MNYIFLKVYGFIRNNCVQNLGVDPSGGGDREGPFQIPKNI